MSSRNVFKERREELFKQDLDTANSIERIRDILQSRQFPYGNLIMESYTRAEAVKHLEIAEMYLRKPAES